MTLLLIGGSGQVGRALTQRLLEQGARPRVTTRSAETAAQLPSGAEGAVADLDRPESLRPALEGVEAVFLALANDPAEMHRGLTALAEFRDSGVRRLVFLTSLLALEAPEVPHAGAKLPVEAAIRRYGFAYTFLRPVFFAQNDLPARDALLRAGIYPHPLGQRPVPRADIRDVADAGARALLTGKGEGASVTLSSPEAPNGPESAALWSEALGREIAYPGDDLAAWAAGMEGLLPPWFVRDLVLMYRHLQAESRAIDEAELKGQEELLGHPPRSYRAFVEECATAWRS